MNTEYCTSCGGRMDYLMHKPKFCPSCGISFAGAGVSPPPPSKRVPSVLSRPSRQAPSQPIIDDPEGTDVNYVPPISHLQYEVDGDYAGISSRPVSLNSIMGRDYDPDNPPSEPQPQKKKGGRSKKQQPPTMKNKFDVIKQSVEECRSSADNVIDVGEK